MPSFRIIKHLNYSQKVSFKYDTLRILDITINYKKNGKKDDF